MSERQRRGWDVIVAGAGPLGASAAAYLAEDGAATLLLAPEEGTDTDRRWNGHGDETRIARKWAPEPTWRLLGERSVRRMKGLERSTGVEFFREVGSLLVQSPREPAPPGPSAGTAHEVLDAAALSARFPYLRFDEAVGIYESREAGYFNPREYVRAQQVRGARAGLERSTLPMTGLSRVGNHFEVQLGEDRTECASDVVVATGAYAAFDSELGMSDRLTVYGRTVCLIEVSESSAQRLASMPSLRVQLEPLRIYALPPIRYPDGRWYLKVGGGPRTRILRSVDELHAWCDGPGDQDIVGRLAEHMTRLIPDLQPLTISSKNCNISVPTSGSPYVARTPHGVMTLLGGSGAGAKSGDELGRLAARRLRGDVDWRDGYDPRAFEL